MTVFSIGQRVIFVGYPGPRTCSVGSHVVQRAPYCVVDQVYTVLGIEQRSRYRSGVWAGVSLHLGFVDPAYGPVWHHHSGFRPAVDRETDISCFLKLLNPVPQAVPA